MNLPNLVLSASVDSLTKKYTYIICSSKLLMVGYVGFLLDGSKTMKMYSKLFTLTQQTLRYSVVLVPNPQAQWYYIFCSGSSHPESCQDPDQTSIYQQTSIPLFSRQSDHLLWSFEESFIRFLDGSSSWSYYQNLLKISFKSVHNIFNKQSHCLSDHPLMDGSGTCSTPVGQQRGRWPKHRRM